MTLNEARLVLQNPAGYDKRVAIKAAVLILAHPDASEADKARAKVVTPRFEIIMPPAPAKVKIRI